MSNHGLWNVNQFTVNLLVSANIFYIYTYLHLWSNIVVIDDVDGIEKEYCLCPLKNYTVFDEQL